MDTHVSFLLSEEITTAAPAVAQRHDQGMVFMGVCLNAIGACLTAGAFIVQKLTHKEEADVHMCMRWRWWLGFSMLLSAGVLEGLSLAWAPLSIVAPLSGLTVLLNTVFAVWFLGEKFRIYEFIIVVCLALGIGCTTLFGPDTTTTAPTDSKYFEHLLFRPIMALYYLGLLMAIIVFMLMIFCYKKCHDLKRVNAFGYAAIAAALGAQQNMFLKCGFTLIKECFDGRMELTTFFFWVSFAGIVFFAIGQITVLNLGLALHDAVSYIPIYQAILVLGGIIAGGAYFSEFKTLSNHNFAAFLCGVVLICAGLVTLTLVPEKEDKEGEENQQLLAAAETKAMESDNVDTEAALPDKQKGNECCK